jgi:hypothetical protein
VASFAIHQSQAMVRSVAAQCSPAHDNRLGVGLCQFTTDAAWDFIINALAAWMQRANQKPSKSGCREGGTAEDAVAGLWLRLKSL